MSTSTGRHAAAVLALVCGSVVGAAAQDLGAAARQERARRAALTEHAPVLSEEDLSRSVILLPSTNYVDIQLQDLAAPPVPAAENSVSLGEYARSLRAARRLRQQRETEAAVENARHDVVPAPAPEEQTFSLGEYAREMRAAKRVAAAARAAAAHSRPPQAAVKVERVGEIPSVEREPAPKSPRVVHAVLKLQPMQPQTSAPYQQVRVQRGDSLWKLAARHLGDGRQWRVLWRLNDSIRNPNVIRTGFMLRLPAAQPQVQDGSMLARADRVERQNPQPKLPTAQPMVWTPVADMLTPSGPQHGSPRQPK